MKKIISLLLMLAISVCCFAGCGASENNNNKIKVVATVFPIYDWVNQVVGDKKDNFEITMLLDSGSDLHSFQPTVQDMVKIADSDLFFYIGGESDGWVEDALKEAPNTFAVNLINELGDLAKLEVTVEGMENDEEEETETETDEHIWLSLVNAKAIVCYIALALGEIDPTNAEYYKANADIYLAQLVTLDAEYSDAVNNAEKDTLVFCDRFPFRYLADDYGINYYAAFAGCSAETEASFKTVSFLAEKVDELNLDSVIVLESSDKKIAETVIANTNNKNQKIIVFDSMQSITSEDVQNGASYLTIMRNNLEAFKEALGA